MFPDMVPVWLSYYPGFVSVRWIFGSAPYKKRHSFLASLSFWSSLLHLLGDVDISLLAEFLRLYPRCHQFGVTGETTELFGRLGEALSSRVG